MGICPDEKGRDMGGGGLIPICWGGGGGGCRAASPSTSHLSSPDRLTNRMRGGGGVEDTWLVNITLSRPMGGEGWGWRLGGREKESGRKIPANSAYRLSKKKSSHHLGYANRAHQYHYILSFLYYIESD